MTEIPQIHFVYQSRPTSTRDRSEDSELSSTWDRSHGALDWSKRTRDRALGIEIGIDNARCRVLARVSGLFRATLSVALVSSSRCSVDKFNFCSFVTSYSLPVTKSVGGSVHQSDHDI